MIMTFLMKRKNGRKPPLPYTASPLELLWADILLVLKSLWSLPGILLPMTPSSELDELYPSKENIVNVIAHVCLALCQVAFLLSVLGCFLLMVPALWISIYVVAFVWINRVICTLIFNYSDEVIESKVPIEERPEHERERWIFINGVGVG